MSSFLLALLPLLQQGEPRHGPPADAPGSGAALHVVDGAPFAVGAAWKAYFDAAGFELHPALGDAAPRSTPLRFELKSVARGGASLALAPAEPRVAGLSVEYDRGGVVERYDVLPQGLEQSFAFRERPAGAGELVVRGRVTTELAAAPAAGAPIRFLGPHGGVEIGRARAFDAGGRAFDGEVRWDGTYLELALGEEALEAARFPLVLDPPIGPVLAVGASADRNADAAYLQAADLYLVAFQRDFSALDRDVYVRRYAGATGASIDPGPVPVAVAAGATAQEPCCAALSGAERFVVAWAQGGAPFGPSLVWGASVATGLASPVGPAAMISDTVGYNRIPDLCGEDLGFDGTGEALCVWESGGKIRLRAIELAFTEDKLTLPGAVTDLADASFDLARPRVPQRASSAGTVALVHERALGETAVALDARPLTLGGTALGSPLALPVAGPPRADVACDGAAWLVVLQTGVEGQGELEYRRLALGAGGFTSTAGTILKDAATDDGFPCVVHAGTKWFVGFSRGTGVLDRDPYALALCCETLALCEPPVALATTAAAREERLALAGAPALPGVPASHSLLAWSAAATAPPFGAAGVSAQRLAVMGPGGPITDLGGGCAGAGTLSVSGPAAVGNPALTVDLSSGSPTAQIALLNVVPLPGAPIACGACVGLAPTQLFQAPYAFGAATQALALPCAAQLVGLELQVQWILYPAGNPCPLFPGFAVSNRARIVLGT